MSKGRVLHFFVHHPQPKPAVLAADPLPAVLARMFLADLALLFLSDLGSGQFEISNRSELREIDLRAELLFLQLAQLYKRDYIRI